MKKLHWAIVPAALTILFVSLSSCTTSDDKEGIVLVNCSTDSLAQKIRGKAKTGDTVIITSDCQENSPVVIDKDITLDGNGNTISGTSANDVIVVNNATVTIKNITITKGRHGIVSKGGVLTTRNVIIKDNSGVGIIAAGNDINEKQYTDTINKINLLGSKNTSDKFDTSKTKLISNTTVLSSVLPTEWYSCATQVIGNASGGILVYGKHAFFGYEPQVCTIISSGNPWGLALINGRADIKNATVQVTNNNIPFNGTVLGLGVAVYASNLSGQGNSTLNSSGHNVYDLCTRNNSTIGLNPPLSLSPSTPNGTCPAL